MYQNLRKKQNAYLHISFKEQEFIEVQKMIGDLTDLYEYFILKKQLKNLSENNHNGISQPKQGYHASIKYQFYQNRNHGTQNNQIMQEKDDQEISESFTKLTSAKIKKDTQLNQTIDQTTNIDSQAQIRFAQQKYYNFQQLQNNRSDRCTTREITIENQQKQIVRRYHTQNISCEEQRNMFQENNIRNNNCISDQEEDQQDNKQQSYQYYRKLCLQKVNKIGEKINEGKIQRKSFNELQVIIEEIESLMKS